MTSGVMERVGTDEAEWLQQWAQRRDYSTVLIAGAGDGSLALALLEMRVYMRVYVTERDYDRAAEMVRRIRAAGFDPDATIRIYQGEAAWCGLWYDRNGGGQVDLLLVDNRVDGLEAVRQTLQNWTPRMAEGGILFLRDCAGEPNIAGALEVICPDWPPVVTFGQTQVLRKVA